MDKSPPPTSRAGGLALWAAALALHGAGVLAAWAYHSGGKPLAAILALCLLCASALVFVLPALFARDWFAPRSTRLSLAAALTLCIPVAGILGGMLASASAHALMRQKNKTREFRETVEMALGEDAQWISRKRVGQVLADEIAIEPVIDVLQGDDPDMKRGAVKLLQRIGTPSAVALLRQSLSDHSPEVRFYAHSALTELEDGFTHRIQAINKILETAPSAGAFRSLGLEYRAYADSGLADETARKQHLEAARDAFIKSLGLEPGHARTMLLLGLALLDMNDLREARLTLEKCARTEETASEAQLGLARMAFQERDFGQLAAQARNMGVSHAPRPQEADSLALFEFWAGQGKARHG